MAVPTAPAAVGGEAELQRLLLACERYPLVRDFQHLNDLAEELFDRWLHRAMADPAFHQRPLVICIPESHGDALHAEASIWALRTLKTVRDAHPRMADAPLIYHVEDDKAGFRERYALVMDLQDEGLDRDWLPDGVPEDREAPLPPDSAEGASALLRWGAASSLGYDFKYLESASRASYGVDLLSLDRSDPRSIARDRDISGNLSDWVASAPLACGVVTIGASHLRRVVEALGTRCNLFCLAPVDVARDDLARDEAHRDFVAHAVDSDHVHILRTEGLRGLSLGQLEAALRHFGFGVRGGAATPASVEFDSADGISSGASH